LKEEGGVGDMGIFTGEEGPKLRERGGAGGVAKVGEREATGMERGRVRLGYTFGDVWVGTCTAPARPPALHLHVFPFSASWKVINVFHSNLNVFIETFKFEWKTRQNSLVGTCAAPACFPFSVSVVPQSEKVRPKPLYVCPGCSIHTYSNNMI
jgi:hypothetical protein